MLATRLESSPIIAEQYGISSSTVLKLLHDRGVTVKAGKIDPVDVPCLIELYEAGQTQQTVGDRFGVTRTAVRYILLQHSVKLRRRTPGR